MKIAIRNNEVFVDYANRFSDMVITTEPYNYQIAIVPDDINITDITYADFDNIDGKFIFNVSTYSLRIAAKKEQTKRIEYKAQIDKLIREKYSINDEIAILRQRDAKTDEFNEYFEFVENVKQKVQSNNL